ncbi:MAG: LAGLIDADG family homing endonuclease [Nanoarchaeota archaeon]
MRIQLKKAKQKELILKAKENLTWEELSKMLNLNAHYLALELREEKRFISEKNYYELCKISGLNFDKFIRKRLEDNWGKSRGGKNSDKNKKSLLIPKESKALAELIGIILGDGHLEERVIGKDIRCYTLKIAGHIIEDREYLIMYTINLIRSLFGETAHVQLEPKYNTIYISLHGKELVNFLKIKGLKPGNKKKNNVGIPHWIKSNKKYLKKCIRGLFDTDGSVHYISKNNKNIRISYTSYIPKLLKDVSLALKKLNIQHSKIIKEKQIFISSKNSVQRFIEEIGFKNEKHLNRIISLSKRAPII